MTTRRLVVPFHMARQDNHRLIPVHGRLIHSSSYRLAKKALALEIMRQWHGAPAMIGAVQLLARVFMPDNRKRDSGNLRKQITDCMSGICFADDSQLWRETWERAGIDRESPRIEIELSAWEERAA